MLGLIDTDPGIDDALALLFAWGSPDLRLAGITTVAGNVGVADATVNLFRLLALRRPTPAPAIAQGAAQPLRRPLVTAQGYHGADGMGELADWPPVQPMQSALSPLSQLDAADFILDAVRTASEPLTLIALGPLTNVALALGRAPRVLAGLERLVVMGGAVDVPGNVTPTAEFNIHVDPEAAAAVLAAGLRLDLVPLDATHQAVLLRTDLEAALRRRPGPVAQRVAAFTDYALRVDQKRGGAGMPLHDPLAVAAALDPTLVTWEAVRLTVESDGQTRRVAGAPNCRFACGVDVPRFLRVFLERLCPAS
jgi:inosine-uridine nucleoside N-ribohydrolase